MGYREAFYLLQGDNPAISAIKRVHADDTIHTLGSFAAKVLVDASVAPLAHWSRVVWHWAFSNRLGSATHALPHFLFLSVRFVDLGDQ